MKCYKKFIMFFLTMLVLKVYPSETTTIFLQSGNQGFVNFQFLNESMQQIQLGSFWSELNNAAGALKSGQNITFSASDQTFTGPDGKKIGSLPTTGATKLGIINGQYSAQYMTRGSQDWKSASFTESLQIALDPSFDSADTQKIIVSGESIASLSIGLDFGEIKSSTDFLPSQLSLINEQFKNNKGVLIQATLDNSGTDYALNISMVSSDGSSLQTIPPIKGLNSGQTIATSGNTLTKQFISYKTSNMKKALLASGTDCAFIVSSGSSLVTSTPPPRTPPPSTPSGIGGFG